MKKFKWLSFAVMGALACTMASCSDDEPGGAKNEQEQGNGFYAITLQLPTAMGSRSKTETPGTGNDPAQSTDGYETGQDYENVVNSMVVVLATKEAGTGKTADKYNYVSHADGAIVKTSSKDQPTFVMQFDSEDLKPYAEEADGTTHTLYIFAFCNPTPTLRETLTNLDDAEDKDISTLAASIIDPNAPEIATKYAFMMTNAELYPHAINETWAELMANHGTRDKAYNLTPSTDGANQTSESVDSNPLKVERTSCRFDFKSTTEIKGTALPAPNTYPIKDVAGTSSEVFANVEIQQLALFNERKEFFAIRHSSPAEDPKASNYKVSLCGTETSKNFVISPDWPDYYGLTDATLSSVYSNYFLSLGKVATGGDAAPNNTQWQKISDLTVDDIHGSSQSDPWDTTDKEPYSGYKIWRYATENTLPVKQQKHEITTGVVFKAEIQPLKATAGVTLSKLAQSIAKAIEEGEPIYTYNEENGIYENTANNTMIFGSALDMYNFCKTNVSSVQRVNFLDAVKAGLFSVTIGGGSPITGSSVTETQLFPADIPTGTVITVTPTDNGKKNSELKEYNLMCYAPATDGKYYCYYYYYNRHNNNGDDSVMGPMEFATVRNNVYKLKVENVLTLGLPQDTPPDPTTDDENPKVFFKVSVKVLDWVVRTNNIIF